MGQSWRALCQRQRWGQGHPIVISCLWSRRQWGSRTAGACSQCPTYPPLSVGVRPNSVHSPTDIKRELSTVTTAAKARPHLDFTMSILPEEEKKPHQSLSETDKRKTHGRRSKPGRKNQRLQTNNGTSW
uniref:Uncharacterized protein n=1 Tax=Laticauda laticaudata TaxID=8630 RepID=A0A8C5S8S2_LATLA